MSRPPHGIFETGELRDGFKFRGGRLALDFGATLAKRAAAIPVELLTAPGDLVRWLQAAGLVDGSQRATARDLAHAQALREALYRMALATSLGDAHLPADRELVNDWSARPAQAPQLFGDASAPSLQWTRRGVRACLAAIAQDGVTLLGGALSERVRKCSACTILFLDLSRSGGRRWCSMAACGNKAKVAAYRRRTAAQMPPDIEAGGV